MSFEVQKPKVGLKRLMPLFVILALVGAIFYVVPQLPGRKILAGLMPSGVNTNDLGDVG